MITYEYRQLRHIRRNVTFVGFLVTPQRHQRCGQYPVRVTDSHSNPHRPHIHPEPHSPLHDGSRRGDRALDSGEEGGGLLRGYPAALG